MGKSGMNEIEEDTAKETGMQEQGRKNKHKRNKDKGQKLSARDVTKLLKWVIILAVVVILVVVGYKLAGMAGTFVAILGTILPPFMIIILISFFYNFFRDNFFVSQMLEGMQAGVGAVIASVTYDMGKGIVQDKNRESVIIMAGAFAASCVCGVNVIYIVLVCGLLGVIQTVIRSRREK